MSRTQRIATLIELYAVLLACAAVIGVVGYRAFRQAVPAFATHSVPAYGEVPVVFFFLPGCPACRAAAPTVEALARELPRQVAEVDSSTAGGQSLLQQYYAAYHVPKAKQNQIPIAFAGQRFFFGAGEVGQELPAYTRQARSHGGLHAPAVPRLAEAPAS